MTNEKGFILPLTMTISLILIIFVLHSLVLYQSDRRFIKERLVSFELNELIQLAAFDLEDRIEDNTLASSGKLIYSKGFVLYDTDKVSGHVVKITFTATIARNVKRSSIFYYDTEMSGITKWKELS
ncbi:ComG operon protein 7 (ComGG) [Scopulibacillus darangshiensis]|uniref:ComG operon protein 7 (ComGG) n=1 Tax=Scopulibacillus darangshiensis TaxID=442528 RepID=A0A4V2SNH5_9BACL|nr:competence type IV pilus minor pilin ComGG [Scopulibacillus darangshiensis]TCP31156.1 ComG operon protein 7 (ComGG) [Scopulibacillus darangshiensis]